MSSKQPTKSFITPVRSLQGRRHLHAERSIACATITRVVAGPCKKKFNLTLLNITTFSLTCSCGVNEIHAGSSNSNKKFETRLLGMRSYVCFLLHRRQLRKCFYIFISKTETIGVPTVCSLCADNFGPGPWVRESTEISGGGMYLEIMI